MSIKVYFKIISTAGLHQDLNLSLHNHPPPPSLLFISPSGSSNPLGSLPETSLSLVLHHPEFVVLLQAMLGLVPDVVAPPAERAVLPVANFSLQLCKYSCHSEPSLSQVKSPLCEDQHSNFSPRAEAGQPPSPQRRHSGLAGLDLGGNQASGQRLAANVEF